MAWPSGLGWNDDCRATCNVNNSTFGSICWPPHSPFTFLTLFHLAHSKYGSNYRHRRVFIHYPKAKHTAASRTTTNFTGCISITWRRPAWRLCWASIFTIWWRGSTNQCGIGRRCIGNNFVSLNSFYWRLFPSAQSVSATKSLEKKVLRRPHKLCGWTSSLPRSFWCWRWQGHKAVCPCTFSFSVLLFVSQIPSTLSIKNSLCFSQAWSTIELTLTTSSKPAVVLGSPLTHWLWVFHSYSDIFLLKYKQNKIRKFTYLILVDPAIPAYGGSLPAELVLVSFRLRHIPFLLININRACWWNIPMVGIQLMSPRMMSSKLLSRSWYQISLLLSEMSLNPL